MKVIIHEDCCSECETFIEHINKKNGNGNKVISVAMETTEKLQLRHLKKKQSKLINDLQRVKDMNTYHRGNIQDGILDDEGLYSKRKVQELMITAESHAIDVVVLTMTQNLSSLGAQIRGCMSIWSLAFVEYYSKVSKSTYNAITAIMDAMKFHSEKSELVEIAFEALFQLASKCVGNASMIIEQNGVHIVARAIKEHSSIECIQEKGISVLCSLIYFYDEAYISMHAIENIVLELIKIMQQYPQNKALQLKVCWAILNLSGSHYNNDELIQIISNTGIISITLNLICRNNLNTEIQKAAFDILGNLTMNCLKNRKEFMKQDGVTCVLKALDKNEKNPAFVASAYSALSNMLKSCESSELQDNSSSKFTNDFIDAMMMQGVMEIIVKTMRLHPETREVQQTACHLLLNLTFDLGVMASFEKYFPLDLLKKAKHAFPDECSRDVVKLSHRRKFVRN